MTFVSVLTAFAIQSHSPPPADACGVKLTIKPTTPRKAVARTSSPSHILLVGKHTRRLERELSSAGHDVEVASTPAAAKRKSYNVVVADPAQADEARSSFGDSVVVSSGDPSSDMRQVESRVARKPTAADPGRTVVGARPDRQPIAAGPPRENREVVAAKEATPPRTETPPPPPPDTRPAVADTKPADTKPVDTKPADTKPDRVATTTTTKVEEPKTVDTPPKPAKQHVAKIPSSGREVYFSVNQSQLSPTMTSHLEKTAKWMSDNPDVQVVIEGHADPTGSASGNMTLSQTRAEAVRDFLVSQGVDQSRIEVIGYGDTRLKYGASDSRNRRVAIVPKK